MNYQVESEDRGDHLHISLLGRLEDRDIDPFMDEVCRHMMDNDHTRILVDSRKQSQSTSTYYDYRQVQRFLEICEGRRFRIAEIVSAAHIESYLFLENVARNRGISFRVFGDESSARAWLLGTET